MLKWQTMWAGIPKLHSCLTLVVLTLFPVLQDHPVRSGRTLHSSPSMHGCIWHHHFWATMEAGCHAAEKTVKWKSFQSFFHSVKDTIAVHGADPGMPWSQHKSNGHQSASSISFFFSFSIICNIITVTFQKSQSVQWLPLFILIRLM